MTYGDFYFKIQELINTWPGYVSPAYIMKHFDSTLIKNKLKIDLKSQLVDPGYHCDICGKKIVKKYAWILLGDRNYLLCSNECWQIAKLRE